MSETIGQRMKRLRMTKTQYTQEQFADKVSILHNTYVRYENDIRKPTAENAAKIADYYHISVNELLNGVDERKKQIEKCVEDLSDEERKIALEYRKLTNERRIALQNYIQFLLSEQEKEKNTRRNAAG